MAHSCWSALFLFQWVTPSGRRWTSPASRGCTWAPTSARLTTASHQRQGKTLKFRFIVSIATFKHPYWFNYWRADKHVYFELIDKDGRKANSSKTLLYLSGLNMMEGILTKSNWLRFPPKPKEAKLNIMGGDLLWYYQQDLDPTIHYITSVNVP